MTVLARMRLAAYLRSYVAFAPALAALVAYAMAYAIPSFAGEAFGVSALILFGLHGWQTKLILDCEPDVQRRLARVAVGPARELAAGLIAALAAGLALLPVLVAVPLLARFALLRPGYGVAEAVGAGLWVHLLAVVPAVALGALSSRAVTRGLGRGAATLAGGLVLVVVLGTRTGPAAWLVPPLASVVRTVTRGTPGAATLAAGTAWTLAWTALLLAGYALLRQRSRS